MDIEKKTDTFRSSIQKLFDDFQEENDCIPIIKQQNNFEVGRLFSSGTTILIKEVIISAKKKQNI